MEERPDDTAKAVKLLQEELRVGAAAAERLHRVCGDCSLRRPHLGMADG